MASATPNFINLIVDIGDVLYSWSPLTNTAVPPKVLKEILHSPTWFAFERGQITMDRCYSRLGAEFSLDPAVVAQAFEEATHTLKPNEDLLQLIRDVKASSKGHIRVFVMSNIAQPHYEILRTKFPDWSMFDEVFTSCTAHERKPHLGFYKHVLDKTGIEPHRTVFVDDKVENVLSARSFGFHGVVFDQPEKAMRTIRNLLSDPVERGREWLTKNAGRLECFTDKGVIVPENFTQLLILEMTNDRSLVVLENHPRIWNFFRGEMPMLDLDTTSVAFTVIKDDKELASSIMDEMLEYLDNDGITPIYFDRTRVRIDPGVCANTLSFFYAYGRGADVHKTTEWIHQILLHRAYVDGTRYYPHGEPFLFYVARLLQCTDDRRLHKLLKPLLRERVLELVGNAGDSLALAMRIIVCAYLGIKDEADMRALLPLQCEDGGWETGWFYKYGKSNVMVGTRGFTTVLAIKSIEIMREWERSSPSGKAYPVRWRHRYPWPTETLFSSPESTPASRTLFSLWTLVLWILCYSLPTILALLGVYESLLRWELPSGKVGM